MSKRRVLGALTPERSMDMVVSPVTSPSPLPPDTPTPSGIESLEDLICPICSEKMVTVPQLNQHIDDVHIQDNEAPRDLLDLSAISNNAIGKIFNNDFIKSDIKKWFGKDEDKDLSPLKRKTIKLDLFEGSQTFSMSDTSRSDNVKSPTPLNKPRVSRTHWKKPVGNVSICLYNNCGKHLNVKNGIVNCRKCGELFCNEHTNYKARLCNPKGNEKLPQYANDGIWSIVCVNCFYDKPAIKVGTLVNSVDLTTDFRKLRASKLDDKQLVADKAIKRFIKLINLITEFYLVKQQQPKGLLGILQAPKFDKTLFNEQQKQIPGYENWENDTMINNCYICFTEFNFLIRKHHCRLCGRIVCDDKYAERKECSLLVPIQLLLEKLSYLNYSIQVQKHWNSILSSNDDLFVTRICRICKDNVLYDNKLKMIKDNKEQTNGELVDTIFRYYNQLLILKAKIRQLLPKYEASLADAEFDTSVVNKFKDKIMLDLQQFETVITDFKKSLFFQNDVREPYQKHRKLIMTINQSLVLFLLDTLMTVKSLNSKLKEKENALLPKKPQVEIPRLTKKQIRELRDQLMVMNEQKFLIENLVKDLTKQRKFDELKTLLDNEEEINKEIQALETKLGDYGF